MGESQGGERGQGTVRENSSLWKPGVEKLLSGGSREVCIGEVALSLCWKNE